MVILGREQVGGFREEDANCAVDERARRTEKPAMNRKHGKDGQLLRSAGLSPVAPENGNTDASVVEAF